MQPGDTRTVLMGYLEPERVNVLAVSREDFMRVVEEVLRDPAILVHEQEGPGGIPEYRQEVTNYDPIRDRILEVASTQTRFPLSSWIEPNRGCGCLVGEYLVAQHTFGEYEEERRRKVAGMQANNYRSVPDILREVETEHDAALLIKFGAEIDEAMKRAFVWGRYSYDPHFTVESLVIVDA